MDINPLRDFFKTAENILNGQPFLFRFRHNLESERPIDLFGSILLNKVIETCMQHYYSLADKPNIDEYANLYRECYYRFDKRKEHYDPAFDRRQYEKQALKRKLEYREIAEEDFVRILLSVVSDVESIAGRPASHFGEKLSAEQGGKTVRSFWDTVRPHTAECGFISVKPYFNFLRDAYNNEYFESMGSDTCTLFHTRSDLFVLLTTGSD